MGTQMRIDLNHYSCLTFKGNAFRIPPLIRRQRYRRLQLCRHQAHEVLIYISTESIPSSAKKIFHEHPNPIYPFQTPATFATSTPVGSVLAEDGVGLIAWKNWPIDSATAQMHRSQFPKANSALKKRMFAGGEILGIDLIEHLLVFPNRYVFHSLWRVEIREAGSLTSSSGWFQLLFCNWPGAARRCPNAKTRNIIHASFCVHISD